MITNTRDSDMQKLITILIALIMLLTVWSLAQARTQHLPICNIPKEVQALDQVANVNPHVLRLALEAYDCAVSEGYGHHQILSIIDFSLPSSYRRLWIFNLKNNHLLFHTYVAHGVGSGGLMATRFSNIPNSYESSLGLYLTGRSYYGEWGYAMRLHGLTRGFDNNVYRRAIVMHGAPYVSAQMVREYGEIGETRGCTAVPLKLVHPIVNRIREGSFIFAYYPETAWLQDSDLLHCPLRYHQPHSMG